MAEPTTPSSPEPTRPMDRVDELLMACLAAPESDWPRLVEELCRSEPALQDEIRRRFEILRGMGMATTADDAIEGVPDELGEFRLVRRLGGGGMGVVYLARQEQLGREVALKLIRPEQLYFSGSRERFLREVQAVARLNHPGIVPVFSVGEAKGVPYFAMERVQGSTLGEVLQALQGRAVATLRGADLLAAITAHAPAAGGQPGPSPTGSADAARLFGGAWVEVCVRLVLRIAEALHHAHERGVIHRDVKPSNVMVTADGRVMLMDFGLAATEGDSRITRTGSQLGSLPYMAPEQIRGEATAIDARTDVYALGVTLFELLTLRLPYDESSQESLRNRIVRGDAAPVRRLNPAVGVDVETICAKAMALEPAHRYATVGALAADLGAFLEYRPIAARRVPLWARTRYWVRREPLKAAVVLLLLLGAAGGLGMGGFLWVQGGLIRAGEEKLRLDAVEEALASGLLLVGEGALAEGVLALREALALDPQCAPAMVGLAEGLVGSGRNAEAEALLRAEVPVLADAHTRELVQARVLRLLKRPVEADAIEQRLPEPRDAVGFFVLGLVAMLRGDLLDDRDAYRKACRLLTSAVMCSARPRPIYHALLAKAAGRAGDEMMADHAVTALQTLWPDWARTRRSIAFAYETIYPDKGIAAWQLVIANSPRPDWTAHSGLGLTFLRKGEHAAAAEQFRLAEKISPGRAKVLTNLSRCLLALEDPAGAERAARDALAADPRYYMAENNLSLALKQLGRPDEARAALQRALKLNPDYAIGWLNLGNTFANQRDLPAATDAYRNAVKANPGYGKAWLFLGDVLRRQDRVEEAVDALRKAAAVLPRDPQPLQILGALLASTGDARGARDAFESAVRVAPQDGDAWVDLATFLADRRESGDWDAPRAVAAARRALEVSNGKTLQAAMRVAGRVLQAARQDATVAPEVLGELERALAESKRR